MKCQACKRSDVLYPVIDRYSNRSACPYCGALDSLLPGEGEAADIITERRAFAEAQGWRYLMRTTFRVHEESLNGHVDGNVVLLYEESEGAQWQATTVDLDELGDVLEHFRHTGELLLPGYNEAAARVRTIPVASLMVANPFLQLRKLPDIEQVNIYDEYNP